MNYHALQHTDSPIDETQQQVVDFDEVGAKDSSHPTRNQSAPRGQGERMSSQDPTKAYQNSPGGQAYQNIPSAGSPTQTEAWALIESARRLAAAIESGPLDEMATRRSLRDSLRLNWRLWTIFQAHLTTDGDDVPQEIRENMLTLCQFVDTHTVDTMAAPTPEKVVALINLNREIASGLFESQKAGVAAQAQEGAQDGADETSTEEAIDPQKPFSIGV